MYHFTGYNGEMNDGGVTFSKRYAQLNSKQKQAVDTIDGPVMVIAGPGTGKTELLSMRVANILRQTDTLPENILCLTYTESGVTAMRERLLSIIGAGAYKVAIHTFHSFGSEVMNQYRDYFYNGALFQPADDVTRYELLHQIFEQLPLGDPLGGTMNGDFTYLRDVQSAITDLKKAGLTSAELLAILDENDITIDGTERLLVPILSATINKKMVEPLAACVEKIRAIDHQLRYEIVPLSDVIADSLQLALDQVLESGKTTALTAWKNRFFEKDKDKNLVLKSRGRQRKLRSLAVIYDLYLAAMQNASLYDYDDMILQVLHAMEVNDDLRYNLQEKFQYLLVDEFQDTNLAQMRLLHNLTNNPVNEDRPNIFIVGDDDQAIYSFQGADVSNILNFESTYPQAERIVLTDNYRSTSTILDASRQVITQGQERLETLYANLSKQLSAATSDKGAIELREAPSQEDERHWLVETIQQTVKQGTKPNDIAVLTRRHRDITELLPYFARAGVPVRYERSDDILSLEPIVLLEKLSCVVVRLSEGRHSEANALLPELLAHPAWGIEGHDLWRLSNQAYDKQQRWLDTMEAIPAFTELREWFIGLASASTQQALPTTLDQLIGKPKGDHLSPLYNYFFSQEALQDNPARYLVFLEALSTLRDRLVEYHAGTALTLKHFTEFIDLNRRIGARIQLRQTIGEDDAITLMTAHAAKGLEYGHVFVVGATDNVWGSKARNHNKLITYPENLQISPAGETYDERLRLFYVALTRAKRALTVSYSLADNAGKGTLPASFLLTEAWQPQPIATKDTLDHRAELAEIRWYQPLLEPQGDLKALLQPRLANYRLSATHLLSFLNLEDGGPQGFLIDHLLHFPAAENVHAAYGSAVHRTLQQAHLALSVNGAPKPLEDSLRDFEENLRLCRLDTANFEKYLKKGSEDLTVYLTARTHTFTPTQKSELNFASQEVVLDDARLTGKLDLVDINATAKTMAIYDYKTGHPARSWKGSGEYEKHKLHCYQLQLMFYKLLVENSRDYSTYTVDHAALEFVEPTDAGDIITLPITFELSEMDRLKKLIAAVWRHIKAVDLPDSSAYAPTFKGTLAFEQDLIDGNI